MFERLLEDVRRISSYHITGGWITPNGELIDIGDENHEDDAVIRMEKITGIHYSEYEAQTGLMQKRGYIRVVMRHPNIELNVSVDSEVTSYQLSTLRELEEKFSHFVYDVFRFGILKSSGKGYSSFLSDLERFRLIK